MDFEGRSNPFLLRKPPLKGLETLQKYLKQEFDECNIL